MSAVDDVYAELEALELAGGETTWGLLRRRMMDAPAPDTVVVITEDGGPLPELASDAGVGDAALEDLGVQVRVRAKAWDGDASALKAQQIQNALHSPTGAVIGTRDYLRVRTLTPEPIFAGYDDKGRPHHTLSLRLLAEQSTAASV